MPQDRQEEPAAPVADSSSRSMSAPPSCGTPGSSGVAGAVQQQVSAHIAQQVEAMSGQPEEKDGSNKRQAQVGQWRTPPLPFFPSGNGTPVHPSQMGGGSEASSSAPAQQSTLAHPGGDYAKALQEAYRRGAEAANALNQQPGAVGFGGFPTFSPGPGGGTTAQPSATSSSGVPLNSAVSCPNLTELRPRPSSSGGGIGEAAATGEEPDPQLAAAAESAARAAGVPYVQPQPAVPGPMPSAATPAPLPYPTAPTQPAQGQPQVPPQVPMVVSSVDHAAPPPSTSGSNAAPVPASSIGMANNGQPRSVSLPDMASYAARANAEEEKRRKRLARNRASARLRRLRKKNLVDSYEGEVGVLESSLAKLRAHEWGITTDHEALLEALSMERGQQSIPPDKRESLIKSILEQQREQVKNVMDCQLETMALGLLANYEDEEEKNDKMGDGDEKETKVKTEEDADEGEKAGETTDEEEKALARELQELLNLSPEQKSQLRSATDGAEEERRAIEAVDACLAAMLSNSWLMNQGVQDITDEFVNILNPGQLSKFLLWTDTNAESIDQLDFVGAPPASAGPVQSPTFVFGMEDGGGGDDGE